MVERLFYICEKCGNMVSYIKDKGPKVVCCGVTMTKLTANTSDGASEKHVPEVKKNGKNIAVSIGSTVHPATDEHHIEWIALAEEHKTTRVQLENLEEPAAVFDDITTPATVYAYCNLHGLWSADI
jgi:superoxide reductase